MAAILGKFYGGKMHQEKRNGCDGFVTRCVLFFDGCTVIIERRDEFDDYTFQLAIHPPKPKAWKYRTAGYSDDLVSTLSTNGSEPNPNGEFRIRNTETNHSLLIHWGRKFVHYGSIMFWKIDPEGSETNCRFDELLPESLFPALPVKPTKVALDYNCLPEERAVTGCSEPRAESTEAGTAEESKE